jgi:hypothetical protein
MIINGVYFILIVVQINTKEKQCQKPICFSKTPKAFQRIVT